MTITFPRLPMNSEPTCTSHIQGQISMKRRMHQSKANTSEIELMHERHHRVLSILSPLTTDEIVSHNKSSVVLTLPDVSMSQNEIDMDENDNCTDDDTWLVPRSISSSSSVSSHSMYSDNDENDVESFQDYPNVEMYVDHIDDDDSITTRSNDTDKGHPKQHRSHKQHYFSAIRQYFLPKYHYVALQSTVHNYLYSYSNFISKTGNQEILLKVLQWSLGMFGAMMIPMYPSSMNNHPTDRFPQWMKKLSYDICYARYVTRLLGLPVALEGAMSGSWATSSSTNNVKFDRIYQIIGKVLAYSMVAYYPIEHIAFFLWMIPNVETILNYPSEVWFYWSMRCWLVYLIAEMIQCMIKLYELRQYQRKMHECKKTDSFHVRHHSKKQYRHQDNQFSLRNNIDHDEDTKNFHHSINNSSSSSSVFSEASDDTSIITPSELNNEMFNVQLLLVRNVFYIFPCMHWSMSTWDTDPWLSDITANGCMWVESVLCLYQAIYNASK